MLRAEVVEMVACLPWTHHHHQMSSMTVSVITAPGMSAALHMT